MGLKCVCPFIRRFFFQQICITVLHHPWMVESTDVEANGKITLGFWTVRRVRAPKPESFRGELYIYIFTLFILSLVFCMFSPSK